MSLRKQQREFASNLLAANVLFTSGMSGAGELPIESLVNVYRNNSRTSLRTALGAAYPVIRRLVGAEFFDNLADQYLRDHPLRCGDLRTIGDYLPEFLGRFEPVSSLPYAADVAHLERAYQCVSRSLPLTDASSVFSRRDSADRLAKLRFQLAPACRFVTSAYPVFSIWKSNQEQYRGVRSITLEEGPQSVLVVHRTNGVELWRLQATDAEFFQVLARGDTLGAAVEIVMSAGHTFNLETLLRNFVQSGCLVIADQAAGIVET